MRILLGFWLVLVVFGRDVRNTDSGDTPKLAEITTSLALFSRVTNGIALQNGIAEKSISLDLVVSELLRVEQEKTIGDLKMLGYHGMTENLAKLEEIVKKVEEVVVEKVSLADGLAELGKMLEMDLEAGTDVTVTKSVTESVTAVTKAEHGLFKDTRLAQISNALKTVLGSTDKNKKPTDSVQIAALLSLSDHLNDPELKEYKEFVGKVEGYEAGEMKDLLALGTAVLDKWKPLATLSSFAKTYKGVDAVKNGLLALKTDVTVLGEVSQHVEALKALRASLDSSFPVVLGLQKPLENATICAGFPGGSKDLERVFGGDLKEKWLKDKVSEGKEWKIMEEHLKELKELAAKLAPIHASFLEFRADVSASTTVAHAFRRISERLARIERGVETWKKTSDDVGEAEIQTAADCLAEVTGKRRKTSYRKLDADLTFWKRFGRGVEKVHTKMSSFAPNEAIKNYEKLVEIGSKIPAELQEARFKMTSEQLEKAVEAIKSIAGIDQFSSDLDNARLEFQTIRSDFRRIAWSEASDFDFGTIESAHSILDDSGLISGLKCLKDAKFRLAGTRNLVRLSANFKKLAPPAPGAPGAPGAGDLTALRGMLGKMETMTNGIAEMRKAALKSRRRRRRHRLARDSKKEQKENPLRALKDGARVSQQLARGVAALRALLAVNAKRELIRKSTQLGEPVDTAVQSIVTPPMVTVWTPATRNRLDEMLGDIAKLEKTAEKLVGEELPDLFSIFENATKVGGVSWSPRLFGDPVATSLSLPHQTDVVQQSTPTFRELAELPTLDFVALRPDLRDAAKHVAELRSFFDDVFGIDRNPPAAHKLTGENGDEEGGKMLLYAGAAGAVLLIVIVVVVVVICLKRKKKSGKQNKWETWRHLAFLPEGQRKIHEGSEYTPLHLAVLKKKTDEVKRRLKNGAYVNVHSCGKRCETPLHTAVDTGKTEIVELLLKAGADVEALDDQYETAKDRATAKGGRNGILKALKASSEARKAAKRVPPQLFPTDKYRIFVDKNVKAGLKEFCKLYKSNLVETVDEATHVVVKTEADGSWDLEKHESLGYLSSLFSPKFIMKPEWLAAAARKKADFVDDYKFRVKSVQFKGAEYKTLDAIHTHFHEMHVPYLTNAVVHFNQANLTTIDWASLKEVAVSMGATVVDEFPVMQGMLPDQCPYYRDDLGHLFIVYMAANVAELEATYPYLRTEKAYTFLDHDEFIAFLLSWKVDHPKLDFVGGGGGGGSGPSKEGHSKESGGSKSKEKGSRAKSKSKASASKSKESKESAGGVSKSKESMSKEGGRSKERGGSREGKSKEASKSKEKPSKETQSKEKASKESQSKEKASKSKESGTPKNKKKHGDPKKKKTATNNKNKKSKSAE